MIGFFSIFVIVGAFISLFFGFTALGDSHAPNDFNDKLARFFLTFLVMDAIFGFGLYFGFYPMSHETRFVSRSELSIAKTQSAVIVEHGNERDVITDIRDYESADQAHGIWCVEYLDAYNAHLPWFNETHLYNPDPKPTTADTTKVIPEK